MIDNATMEMVCGIAGKALKDVILDADMTKPGDAELIKALVSTMYKAECMMDGGYSQRGYSRDGYSESSYNGNSGNGYDRGTSYARRRDSMGRYSRYDYSRGSMLEHIDKMMAEAETEEQREKIRRFKEQMM